MSVRILLGDCRLRLRDLPDASVDSCVCDPPYHLTSIVKRFGNARSNMEANADAQPPNRGAQFKRLSKGFMGQTWDGGDVAFREETWAEVLRVLKPGGHLVAFSGTRTYHRMVVAIEDAGFEVRDQLAWIFGSGFPKSKDLGAGWGTALKPAWEPICLARKSLIGTNAANMAEHGVAGLNIDACRIEAQGRPLRELDAKETNNNTYAGRVDGGSLAGGSKAVGETDLGRWPANLCHDGSEEVLAGFPNVKTGAGGITKKNNNSPVYSGPASSADRATVGYDDDGSAARFFYCAKADGSERHAGCDDLDKGNNHPTVKPVTLMRWLCRLVTPPGGTVLDPFMGSGSTAIAADAEQFNFIGCELSADYAAIAERRIKASAGLFADISIEHCGPQAREQAA